MTQQTRITHRQAATFAWVAALVLWIAFIWGNSLVPGDDSSQVSGFFVQLLSPVFDAIGLADANLRVMAVRKFAHVAEHAILAILATGALRRVFDAAHLWWPAALTLCVAVPSIDEAIQLFVPGRVGAFTDVCIDLCGCAAGALIAWLVRLIMARRCGKGEVHDV